MCFLCALIILVLGILGLTLWLLFRIFMWTEVCYSEEV